MRKRNRFRGHTGSVNLQDYKTNLPKISSEDVTQSLNWLYVYAKKEEYLSSLLH